MDRFPPLRVLIVEDDALIASDLKEIIESAGYVSVGIAARSVDAIRIAADTDPDLILMDVNLAGAADGISTAYAIHAQKPVPVVFVTAYGDAETASRVRAFNGSEPVAKPVDRQRLIRAMNSAAPARALQSP